MTESKVDLSSPHLSRACRLFVRYFDPDAKGFNGFHDPRYLEQERNYKVTTAELAARLLSEPELRALIDAGNAEEVLQRTRQVGQKSNLLYLAVPQTGDLAPLLRPLEPAPRLSLARGILELLHGAEAVAARVDRFLALLTSLGLPAHWQLFSYLLFFVHPSEEVFIKPTAIGRALELLGAPVELAEAPSGRVYERVRSIAHALRQELADWQPADLIDVQSFLFVVALAFERSAPLEIKLHKELRKLLGEFRDGYLKTAAGKQHLASYERDRLAIQANFHAVLEQERQGLDTTDTVLCKLLPHSDTAPNRDSGKLVSIAPVITTDLRQWFEGVKWATPEDWPGIARAILRFYQRCQADPAVLEVAVKEFLAQEIKGIQAGYLSPILAGLRPDQFRISNKKPRQVLGYLRNQEYGAGLDQYPRFNSDLGELLTWIEPDLVALCDAPGQPAADLFDCYSHWLVGVRNFFNRKYWKIAPGELAHDWERQLSAGVIAIGWEKIKDLSWFDSKEALKEEYLEHYRDEPTGYQTLWLFFSGLNKGDIVIANRGQSQIMGLGVITGDYHYNPDEKHYVHARRVNWYDMTVRTIEKQGGWIRTIRPVDHRLFASLGLPDDGGLDPLELPGNPREPGEKSSMDKTGSEVTTPPLPDPYVRFSSLFESIDKTLVRKGQIILFGPPGTGKSFIARAFARQWVAQRLYKKPFFHLTASQQQELEGRPVAERAADPTRAWWVCANPKVWSWEQLFSEGAEWFGPGRIERHFAAVAVGDLVFGYQSAPARRLLALARISKVGIGRNGQPGPGIELEPLKYLPEAARLAWRELAAMPELVESEPIQQGSRGTLFALAPAEVSALLKRLRTLTDELPDDVEDALPEDRSLAAPRVEWVTFHPAFGYEEFMEALRPQMQEDGGLRFEIRPGTLLRMAERAQQHPGDRFVLIIDEINRGNVARTFGELITLLERDKRDLTVTLPASGRPFRLPENLYIIGTMNTSDRSITQLDVALRRRFGFLEMQPDPSLLDVSIGDGLKLSEAFDGLNRRIRRELGREKQIGHSFFLRSGEHGIGECPPSLAHVRDVLRQEIVPLLLELCYEDPDQIRRILSDGVLDPSTMTLVEALSQDAPLIDVLRSWSRPT